METSSGLRKLGSYGSLDQVTLWLSEPRDWAMQGYVAQSDTRFKTRRIFNILNFSCVILYLSDSTLRTSIFI